jgi:sugar lactone lactonase YvrE
MSVSEKPVPRPRAPRLIRAAKAPATRPPPLAGAWSPTDDRLDGLEVLRLPRGAGPEDVAFDADGRAVTGDEEGRLWRWPASPEAGQGPELIAETGGRPLGIELDPRDGSLIVCDAYRGLLRVTDGRVSDLADRAGGRRIMLCDNASIARDGVVYFSDSSDRYPLSAWKRDLLEHRPNGRILAYDPVARRVDVVAEGLYFPNGVALGPDESWLMVAETTTHRLTRIPLGGGDPVPLADLPAYPDNISAVGDGTFWVALPSPRVAIAERLLPHPLVRRLVVLLPDALQPQPLRYGLVAQVDSDGQTLRTLHGPAGRYSMITGVRQHGQELWVGSLTEPGVGRIRL